mmetsp:Transcript_26413/g.85317  ORF Transcript_26413/g.85317 Transcript_26413/m.85317 type:complete len:207 (+) Transcript_26413:1212-1832(+)
MQLRSRQAAPLLHRARPRTGANRIGHVGALHHLRRAVAGAWSPGGPIGPSRLAVHGCDLDAHARARAAGHLHASRLLPPRRSRSGILVLCSRRLAVGTHRGSPVTSGHRLWPADGAAELRPLPDAAPRLDGIRPHLDGQSGKPVRGRRVALRMPGCARNARLARAVVQPQRSRRSQLQSRPHRLTLALQLHSEGRWHDSSRHREKA